MIRRMMKKHKLNRFMRAPFIYKNLIPFISIPFGLYLFYDNFTLFQFLQLIIIWLGMYTVYRINIYILLIKQKEMTPYINDLNDPKEYWKYKSPKYYKVKAQDNQLTKGDKDKYEK